MDNLEIRSLSNVEAVDEMVVEGYALVFNKESEDMGGWREVILPTALENTDLSDVRMFADHDSSKVLGRTKSGTLQIEIDDVGLKVRCTLPNTTVARDLYESVKRGDIDQMSFGFYLRNGGDAVIKQTDGSIIRQLHDIEKIHEVSIVSIPAYADTTVATRSLKEAMKEQEKHKLLIQLEMTKLQMEL